MSRAVGRQGYGRISPSRTFMPSVAARVRGARKAEAARRPADHLGGEQSSFRQTFQMLLARCHSRRRLDAGKLKESLPSMNPIMPQQ